MPQAGRTGYATPNPTACCSRQLAFFAPHRRALWGTGRPVPIPHAPNQARSRTCATTCVAPPGVRRFVVRAIAARREKREEAGSNKEKMGCRLPATSSSCPSPPWTELDSPPPRAPPRARARRRRSHPSSGSPARRSSRRGAVAAVHPPPCSSPHAAAKSIRRIQRRLGQRRGEERHGAMGEEGRQVGRGAARRGRGRRHHLLASPVTRSLPPRRRRAPSTWTEIPHARESELGTNRWGRRRRVGGVEWREKGGEVEKEDDTWGPQVLVGME
jgi:hypothetical protein